MSSKEISGKIKIINTDSNGSLFSVTIVNIWNDYFFCFEYFKKFGPIAKAR